MDTGETRGFIKIVELVILKHKLFFVISLPNFFYLSDEIMIMSTF